MTGACDRTSGRRDGSTAEVTELAETTGESSLK